MKRSTITYTLAVAVLLLAGCAGPQAIEGVKLNPNGTYQTFESKRNATDKATMQCGRQGKQADVIATNDGQFTFICKHGI